jgi:hypothetical protein
MNHFSTYHTSLRDVKTFCVLKTKNQNQDAHHKNETFLEEYVRMLEAFEIEYDEHYIFKESA